MSFKNKVVIVTGAGSGIGAATAITLAKEGADIVIVDCNEETAKYTADKCNEFRNNAFITTADISNDSEANEVIKKTIAKFGKLDVLINNAAIIREASILSGNLMKTYDEVMNTNLRAIMSLTSFSAPYLAKTKGCIVNVLSAWSTIHITGAPFVTYCVSKAGVDAFTRISALELASIGVRVNAVNPGPVRTHLLTPLGLEDIWSQIIESTGLKKLSGAEEIANLIVYLASDKAKSVTGSCYPIENGMRLL